MEETKSWLSERHRNKYNSNEIVENENRLHRKIDYFLRLQCQTEVELNAVSKRMLFATRRKMIQPAFTKATLGMMAKTDWFSKRHILKILRKGRPSGSEHNFLISSPHPVNVCKSRWPGFLHFYHPRRPAPLFHNESLTAF